MRTAIILTAAALSLGACATQDLAEYRPVVDASGPGYERDLAECRAIALNAEAEYRQRQQAEMGANLLAGILVGALAGQAVGGNTGWTAAGAAYGAGAGLAATDTELAHGGPRRVIDRCLAGRGHRVLSDLGRG